MVSYSDLLTLIFLLTTLIGFFIRYPVYDIGRHIYKRQKKNTHTNPKLPAVSIIVICQDQGSYLQKNIPAIAQQRYPSFEIIIVDLASTDQTQEIIKQLKKDYPFIRHTYVPLHTRYICPNKLAVTLGIKAAKYEWIILTKANAIPSGPLWIENLSQNFTSDKTLVLGYVKQYIKGQRKSNYRNWAYFIEQSVSFHSANNRLFPGKALGGDACNMAFRKSAFHSKNGYGNNLSWLNGEDILLTNQLAGKRDTAVSYSPETIMTQELFSAREFQFIQFCRISAYQHINLRNRYKLHTLTFCFGLSYVQWASVIGAIILYLNQGNYIFAIILTFIIFVFLVLNSIILYGSTKKIGEKFFFSLPLYELYWPLKRTFYRLYVHLHRKQFKRHI